MERATSTPDTTSDLAGAYDAIRREAVRVAGGPGDIPPRAALLHSIFLDSGGNHAFPEVALHGALWAYGFYERRGAVSRMISYRYFYDAEERASRSYMLFEFSQGFKEANRSVFVDTYTNYFFTKAHGEQPGAEGIVPPELLEALLRVHHAAARGGVCRGASVPRCSRPRCASSRRRRSGPRCARRCRSSNARS